MFSCFPSVHLSSETSEEETPQLGGNIHRLGHRCGHRSHQQGLPAPGLFHVSQTPGNPRLLSKSVTAGLLGSDQSEHGEPAGAQQEGRANSERPDQQTGARNSVFVHRVCQQ